MTRPGTAWFVFACAVFGARTAAAGPKVEFMCGVYEKDTITDIVPNPKNPKIDKPVACALHLPDASKTVYKGSIMTRRHMVNETTGDQADVEMQGEGGELSHKAGAEAVDVEVIMTPGKENAAGDIPFDVCESFDILGVVTDAKGIVFRQELKVVQRCPKAKPAAAKAAPPPPPPPSSGSTIDDLLAFHDQPIWTAYDFQTNGGMIYAVAACFDPGTNKVCEGAVITDKGKVLKKLSEIISKPVDGEVVLDPAAFGTVKAAVGKLVAGNSNSNKLVEHVLGASTVTFDTIGFKWAAKTKTLTVLNGKKTFKTLNVGKLVNKGATINQVAVYLFEAGSPPAAIVRVQYAGTEDSIEDSYVFATVALPEIAGD